jgi:structure-specific recognition protein 1
MTTDKATVADNQSIKGWTWGKVNMDDTSLSVTDAEGHTLVKVIPADVSQVTIQGKSDLALEFVQEAADKEDEYLTELRFFVPNEELLTQLKEDMSKRVSGAVGGEKVCSLDNLPLVLPRGHFDLDFFTSSLKMRGKSFDYAIKYSNINRAFVLMKPDGVHVAFVIGLDKPVRQGNTAYNFLCAQFDMNRTETSLPVRLADEAAYAEAGLEADESGKPLADVLQRLLKHFGKVSVQFACLDFKATNGKNCVRCSHRATEGHLYCLKRAFIFITKPVVYIKYEDVVAVEFSRAESWMTQTRFFDLKVYKKGENQPYDFQQIDRNEYQPLIEFLQSAGIRIRNLDKKDGQAKAAPEAEQGLMDQDFDDDEEDSEFEDDEDEDEDDDDDDDEDEDDEDESEDDEPKKKKKKHRDADEVESERREKKHKKEKKEKKDKKHKKEKKEKKHKRERDD